MKLSPRARDGGWIGLVPGTREAITAAKLKPCLQETFFDGESAWRLLLQPVFWGAAAVLFLLAGWIMLRERLRHEQRHGRRTKGPELLSALRSTYRAKADGIRFRLRFENPLMGRLPFGPGYRIPRKLESSNIPLMGDTGSGKSTAIRQLLRQVQERGESAIVYDPAMDFVGEFYDPKRGDLILNPLDARCPYWNLGAELVREETSTTIAAAFLPDTEYEKEFFADGPRRILASVKAEAATERHFGVDGRTRSDGCDGEGAPPCRSARSRRAATASGRDRQHEHGCRQLGVAAGIRRCAGQGFFDCRVVHGAEAVGVSDLERRLSREAFATAQRVARPVHFAHDDDTSATNEIKEMAQRSELYLLRRAHGIYYNLVPLLTLGSIEALCLAGKGNARIDVNVM
jgi:hypothetical protein